MTVIRAEGGYTVRVFYALCAKAKIRKLGGGIRAKFRKGESMKKIGFLSVIITATLLLTLAFTASAAGPKVAPSVAAAAVASPAVAAPTPMPPPHPRVHEALEEMRHAREHLQHAEGDFHGHRAQAVEHLEKAIHEAEECEREP